MKLYQYGKWTYVRILLAHTDYDDYKNYEIKEWLPGYHTDEQLLAKYDPSVYEVIDSIHYNNSFIISRAEVYNELNNAII